MDECLEQLVSLVDLFAARFDEVARHRELEHLGAHTNHA
jgi:hypothetical protein